MKEINITDYDTRFLWEKALLLLSLDRVRPFWDEMGVQFSFPEQVQAAVRDFITEKQKLNLDNDPDYLKKISLYINKVFSDVIRIEGDKGAETIYDWIENFILRDESSNWVSAWYGYFVRDLDESQAPVLIRLGLSDEKTHGLLDLTNQYCKIANDIGDRIDEAENQTFSEWESIQYQIYQRESPDISPLDYLDLDKMMFFEIWHKILLLLNRHEMDILNEWGQFMATIKNDDCKNAEIPMEYRVLES